MVMIILVNLLLLLKLIMSIHKNLCTTSSNCFQRWSPLSSWKVLNHHGEDTCFTCLGVEWRGWGAAVYLILRGLYAGKWTWSVVCFGTCCRFLPTLHPFFFCFFECTFFFFLKTKVVEFQSVFQPWNLK